jgi:hypothetical protein
MIIGQDAGEVFRYTLQFDEWGSGHIEKQENIIHPLLTREDEKGNSSFFDSLAEKADMKIRCVIGNSCVRKYSTSFLIESNDFVLTPFLLLW